MVTEKPSLHDPRVLRALAHPVRNRILTELSATGPLRAADIARDLGIPANQASFHLRQLAKYGLVEEDPDAARDRRDRVWKLVADTGYTIELGEVEKAPGGKAASAVFRRTRAAWAHVVVDEAYGDDRSKDTMRSVMEQSIKLTKDEAKQLCTDLQEVADRWSLKTRGRDDARRTYLLFQIVQPFPERSMESVDG
ncbi:MAG: ArsR family transcriptional regulator [Nocardioides sp.]|nr:ArsR family transcriptional regulator [Nocardioides sp.]